MKSFYPKGNWVKWKSRIEESVESLIKWAFEKTVNKSWQNRWESRKTCHDKGRIECWGKEVFPNIFIMGI
jgi:hypothetical protein